MNMKPVVYILLIVLFPTPCSARNFRDLNARECVEIALERSLFSRQIEQQATLTRSSRFAVLSTVLPQVTFASGFARTTTTELVFDPAEGAPVPTEVAFNQYQAAFNFFLTLIDISSWVEVNQIATTKSIADATFIDAKADLALRVKTAFYNLITLYNDVDVARAAQAQIQQQVQIAGELLRLGTIARPELLRLEVALIQQRVEAIRAAQTLQNQLGSFGDLIGVAQPFSIDTAVSFPDTRTPIPDPDTLRKVAVQKNPSLRVSLLRADNQRAAASAVRLSRIPTVSLSFAYGYSAPEMFTGLGSWRENDFWNLGVTLTVALFEGLQWRGQMQKTAANAALAQIDLKITENSVMEQLNSAYTNLQANREALLLIPDLLRAAEEELRLVQEQFRLGAASSLDILQSQSSFSQARQQSTAIISSFYQAEALLLRLMGQW